MCVKPLKGIVYGINPQNGKKKIKVVKDFYIPTDNENVIPIPCGKCIECRLNHARVWSDRMMAEASLYTDNVFLTLTYNDKFLPEPEKFVIDTPDNFADYRDHVQAFNINHADDPNYKALDLPEPEQVEYISPVHPLVKRDVQLFIKRLRKHFPDTKIRFYACGEYGDSSLRPHYHMILFNCRLDDLQLFMTNEQGFKYYTSKTIEDLWTERVETDDGIEWQSKGYHFIAQVNWQTCNYVARYVTKKLIHGYDDMPEKLHYPREFSLMSLKPGIGAQWFEDHRDSLVFFNESFLSTDDGAKKITMNKYFDHLLEIDDEYIYNLLKVERAEIAQNKEQLYEMPFAERMKNKEIDLEARTSLIRQRKEV